jgi:hypothetical protein
VGLPISTRGRYRGWKVKGQLWFRISKLGHLPALKTTLPCILLHFLASGRKQKCPAYLGESCEENKNDLIPRVALSQRAKLFWHALHSEHDGGLFSSAASRFLLSLFPSFFFFSLSPLLLSPFCFKKTDYEKGAPGREPGGWYGKNI